MVVGNEMKMIILKIEQFEANCDNSVRNELDRQNFRNDIEHNKF